MSIVELGALGEFFGAIAVAVTLIFLVIQVRHSSGLIEGATRTSAGLGYHSRTVEQIAFNNQIVADAELARIWHAGCQCGELNESDSIRFELLLSSHWTLWRGSWARADLIGRPYYDKRGQSGNYAAEEMKWEFLGKPGLQHRWREKLAMEQEIMDRVGGDSNSGFIAAAQQALGGGSA